MRQILRLVAWRLLQLVPVIVGVSILAFMVLNVLPGNVDIAILGLGATPASIAVLNKALNLNHPIIVRYWNWLTGALHGNLGSSLFTHQSVTAIIGARAPVSLELGLLAIILALCVAIPLSLLTARRPDGLLDRALTVLTMAAISMPGFVLALLLILLFAVKLRLVEPVGFVPLSQSIWLNLKSLLLPAISLATFPIALYLRILRGDLHRAYATEAYVETARAKGATEWRIILRHVLPNACFSLLTVVALNLGTIVGGAVIIEQIFGLPGMGQTLVAGINDRDSPVVQGVVVCLALAVVVANLLADMMYLVLDPRLRHDS